MSSEESSVHSDYGTEEDYLGKSRNKHHGRGRPKRESHDYNENLRNTRRTNRSNRVKYDKMDISSASEEEEKIKPKQKPV